MKSLSNFVENSNFLKRQPALDKFFMSDDATHATRVISNYTRA
jgi:hypothetical protein